MVAAQQVKADKYVAAIKAAGLEDWLTSDSKKATVIALSDAAMDSLGAKLTDPVAMKAILLGTIVPGKPLLWYSLADKPMTTAANTILTGVLEKSATGGADVIKVNGVGILKSSRTVSANGILYLADKMFEEAKPAAPGAAPAPAATPAPAG
jgi:hypothetical protein